MWIDRRWPRFQDMAVKWVAVFVHSKLDVDRKGQDWNTLCYDSSGWVPIYVNINQLCWSQGILIKRNPSRKLSLLGQDYDLITLKLFKQSFAILMSSPVQAKWEEAAFARNSQWFCVFVIPEMLFIFHNFAPAEKIEQKLA